MDTWSSLEPELNENILQVETGDTWFVWKEILETELNIYHKSFHSLWLITQLAETQLTFGFLKTVKFLRKIYLFLTYFINKIQKIKNF